MLIKNSLFSITHKVLGQLDTNMYLLDFGKRCLIVDPAEDAKDIIDTINKTCPKAKPDIFLTHGHFDHIMAVPELCDFYKDASIFASKDDLPLFTNPMNNLSNEFCKSTPVTLEKVVNKMKFLKEGDQLKIENITFDILNLAGHTPGSIGLLSKAYDCAFVGDTLLKESIGAVTFPFADDDLMMKNIRQKLMTLKETTNIYPGHGEITTVDHEKKENFFVSGNEMNAEKRFAKILSALSMELLEPKVTDYLVHCV